ncbi:MAG: hydrogenase nickel incorporation protein HypB [Deltaproteobacteria bacterium]
MEIKVMKNIMHSNSQIAEENREAMKAKNICAVNILASPGAGKTSVLVKLIEALRNKVPLAVIEGDIEGSIDAERIDKMGIPVIQINTCGGCHLDANMIKEAMVSLKPTEETIIFIENVGNLVCPSSFDLGETLRIVIASVTEGSDKPIKYPKAFQTADLIVLNKTDLVEHTDFDKSYFYKGINAVSDKKVIEVSCVKNSGIKELAEEVLKLCKRG